MEEIRIDILKKNNSYKVILCCFSMSPQEDYILEITSPDMDSLLQTEGFIGEGAIKSVKKFYESFVGWYLTDQDPSVSSFHMASKVKGSYLKKNPSLLFPVKIVSSKDRKFVNIELKLSDEKFIRGRVNKVGNFFPMYNFIFENPLA